MAVGSLLLAGWLLAAVRPATARAGPTPDPAASEPLPVLSIANRSRTVTLSWTSQATATEIVAASRLSAAGGLGEAVVATDRDFRFAHDAGRPGEAVRFEVPKPPGMAFFAPRANPARGAPAGVRLDGTFIQYQSWMTKLGAEAWQRELDAIQRAGLRLVIVQWVQYNQTRFLPADPTLELDLTERLLAHADREGLQVFLGLAMDDGWWNQSTDGSYLDRTAEALGAVAEEVWRRYGAHRSFAGWYIPQESWDAEYSDSQTTLLRRFFRQVSDRCKQLSGGKPVAFSPFFSGRSSPTAMERFYSKLLEGAGLDILMLQDGVGARGWDTEVAERVTPYFRAVSRACLQAGVAFWSDLESFQLAGGGPSLFVPADLGRLCQQMTAEAPWVEHLVTFDFFHYLSPQRGAAQQRLHDDYVKSCVERPFFPTFGRSVQVDPQFGYYRDRSPASIAAEIRGAGYAIVRYILTADSTVRPELVEAFHREGLGVWYATFVNGTYSTNDLPSDWPAWRMVTRSELAGQPLSDGYTRLCLNNTAYRAWKKRQMVRTLERAPFQGVDLMEPHWPEYPGPQSPAYACFCPSCRQAFSAMFPGAEVLPDILDPQSPRSPARNPGLWQKWLEFRRRTLTACLDDLVNGPGGLRANRPATPVCVWTLALSATNGLEQVRELHGEDPAEMARVVKPDLLCFQTHWPDWIRADLKADYVLAYRPYLDAVRAVAPDLPLMIQADTGSQPQNRRSWTWIRAFERACSGLGVQNTTFYEYFIGDSMYADPPRLVAVDFAGDRLEVRFSKRLDPECAVELSHYQLSLGRVVSAQADGSRVLLTTEGADAPGVTLTVRGLKDAADRRLFQDRPVTTLGEQTVRLR